MGRTNEISWTFPRLTVKIQVSACSTIGRTIAKTAAALSRYPGWIRPFIHHIVPEARHYQQSLREIESLLCDIHQVCDI